MKKLAHLCLTFILFSIMLSLMSTPRVFSEPEEVPKIFLSPNTSSQAPSGTFTVDINVMNVRQLFSWQFYLSWTNSMLNASKVDEGPFLSSSGAYNSFFIPKIFNNPAENPVSLPSNSSRTLNFLGPRNVTQIEDNKGASITGGADGDFVAGSEFPIETGNIERVAIRMRYNVTSASTSDEVKLGYSVSGVEGPTSQSFKPTSTDWTYVDVDVTADRKWTRNDIVNTEVFLQYDRVDAADTWTIYVDVLEVLYYSSYIFAADTLLGVERAGSPSGAGTIATVTFLAEAQGVSTLELWGVKLIDFDGDRFVENPAPSQYPVIVEDGYFAYPIARLSVNPSAIVDSTKGAGSTFTININITGAQSVFNWSLALKWSASILDAATVSEGSFLNSAGTTSFSYQINQAAGNLTANSALTGAPLGGVNGSGILVSVTFNVETKGSTVLDAYNAKLFDRAGTFIPHDVLAAFDVRNDGYFSNQRRDVSISEVRLSTTSVTAGDSVNINVTVRNLGEINETFTVTVFYASSSIGSKSVTNLAAGGTATLTFTWVTSNVPAGDYEIKAQTSTILGDVNTADNSLVASSRVAVGSGGPNIPWTLIAGGVVVVALAIVVVLLLMRRGKGASRP